MATDNTGNTDSQGGCNTGGTRYCHHLTPAAGVMIDHIVCGHGSSRITADRADRSWLRQRARRLKAGVGLGLREAQVNTAAPHGCLPGSRVTQPTALRAVPAGVGRENDHPIHVDQWDPRRSASDESMLRGMIPRKGRHGGEAHGSSRITADRADPELATTAGAPAESRRRAGVTRGPGKHRRAPPVFTWVSRYPSPPRSARCPLVPVGAVLSVLSV